MLDLIMLLVGEKLGKQIVMVPAATKQSQVQKMNKLLHK